MKSVQIDRAMMSFLSELRKNNNRNWFNANKAEYEYSRNNFADFLDDLITVTARFDTTLDWLVAEDCMFRTHRDLRFSRDKTPYKPGFGAHLVANGRRVDKGLAGYYIHVEPGLTRIACGSYQPPSPWLKRIRAEIANQGEAFEAIVKNPDFHAYFGELRGDTLKTIPRGYDKNHLHAEWLKRKGFLAYHSFDDSQVLSPDFVSVVAAGYQQAFPLIKFLNAALPDIQ